MRSLIYARYEANYRRSTAELENMFSKAAATCEMDFDAEQWTAQHQDVAGRCFGFKSVIEIEEEQGAFSQRVIEYRMLSIRWVLTWMLPMIIGGTYLYLGGYWEQLAILILDSMTSMVAAPESVYIVAGAVPIFGPLFLSLIVLCLFLYGVGSLNTSLVEVTREQSEGINVDGTVVFRSPILLILPIFSVLFSEFWGLKVAGLLFYVLYVVSAAGVLIFFYRKASPVYNSELPTSVSIPRLNLFYLVTVTVVVIYTYIGSMTADFGARTRDVADLRPSLFYLSLIVTSGIVLLAYLVWRAVHVEIIGGDRKSYFDFVKDQDPVHETCSTRTRVVFFAASVLSSYCVVWTGWIIWKKYITLGFFERPVLVVVGLSLLGALAYFPLGIAYQTVTYASSLWFLFRNSTPSDPTVTYRPEVEFQTRELSGVDGYYACSWSCGVAKFVFVSEPLLEEMAPKHYSAVIAHEEHHLKRGDALLSTAIQVVSLVTLTGRNVLYRLVDYSGREHEADSYARRKTSAEQLATALETIAQAQKRERAEQIYDVVYGAGVPPISGELHASGRIEKLFRVFYGSFAIDKAHPELEERIDRQER